MTYICCIEKRIKIKVMKANHLTVEQITDIIINGGCVYGLTAEQEKELRKRLIEIKSICIDVLSQIKNK